MKSQADFDATVRYNRTLGADCREHTGPLYDHVDTWQTVRDVDAIRKALGESQISFHGSSYETMLGGQYAETYPGRARAVVIEAVMDHSAPNARQFLDTEAATGQDSFDEFVKWCDQATTCSLHGRALLADLLQQADRGEIPDPRQPNVAITPFNLSFALFRTFYNPQHPLKVHDLKTPVLLAGGIHDPATAYSWAQNVARQLGRYGVLMTYEGWGHGSYTTSPCMQSAIDAYLISRQVPKRGSTCPAVPPVG